MWPSGQWNGLRTMRSHVQTHQRHKSLVVFFSYILALAVTWYMTMVGGERYPMELVEVSASLSKHHGYKKMILYKRLRFIYTYRNLWGAPNSEQILSHLVTIRVLPRLIVHMLTLSSSKSECSNLFTTFRIDPHRFCKKLRCGTRSWNGPTSEWKFLALRVVADERHLVNNI